MDPLLKLLQDNAAFQPAQLAGMLGVLLASLTARLLNRYRWSRFFFYPPLVFVALTVLYTVAIGYVLIPF